LLLNLVLITIGAMEEYTPTDASAYADWRLTDIPKMIGLDESAETRCSGLTALIPADNHHYPKFKTWRHRENVTIIICGCLGIAGFALLFQPTLEARLPKFTSIGLTGAGAVFGVAQWVSGSQRQKEQKRLVLSLHEAYRAEAGVIQDIRSDPVMLGDSDAFDRLLKNVRRDLENLLVGDRISAEELINALVTTPKPLTVPQRPRHAEEQ
jgi:hypothetical protein